MLEYINLIMSYSDDEFYTLMERFFAAPVVTAFFAFACIGLFRYIFGKSFDLFSKITEFFKNFRRK